MRVRDAAPGRGPRSRGARRGRRGPRANAGPGGRRRQRPPDTGGAVPSPCGRLRGKHETRRRIWQDRPRLLNRNGGARFRAHHGATRHAPCQDKGNAHVRHRGSGLRGRAPDGSIVAPERSPAAGPFRVRLHRFGYRGARRPAPRAPRTGRRIRRGRAPGELRHHPLARGELPRRGARGTRPPVQVRQLERRKPELRKGHRQQHVEAHHGPRPRLPPIRRVRPGHRVRRLRERRRRPRPRHPSQRRGEGHRRTGLRGPRRLRHRRVRAGRHPGRRASRPARAQLGRELLHRERHQRLQPLRRRQAQAPGLGAARGTRPNVDGLGFGRADRRLVRRGLLPARVGRDGDRSGRELLLDQRHRGPGGAQGDHHPRRPVQTRCSNASGRSRIAGSASARSPRRSTPTSPVRGSRTDTWTRSSTS